MLTQKIISSENKPVKYHGNIKFITFECNFCRRHFSKMASYYKKQLKSRPHACCFCSPECRNDYFKESAKLQEEGKSVPSPKGKIFLSWIEKFFKG